MNYVTNSRQIKINLLMFQELLKDNVQTFANENKRLHHKLQQMEAYSSHSAAAGSASASMNQTSLGESSSYWKCHAKISGKTCFLSEILNPWFYQYFWTEQ